MTDLLTSGFTYLCTCLQTNKQQIKRKIDIEKLYKMIKYIWYHKRKRELHQFACYTNTCTKEDTLIKQGEKGKINVHKVNHSISTFYRIVINCRWNDLCNLRCFDGWSFLVAMGTTLHSSVSFAAECTSCKLSWSVF